VLGGVLIGAATAVAVIASTAAFAQKAEYGSSDEAKARPGGTDPLPKEAYITRVGDEGCGVGYYK
jgi:hypothetical protein